jgi:RNA polymerase subunit RPABC4/transcription elongation factor Spt4
MRAPAWFSGPGRSALPLGPDLLAVAFPDDAAPAPGASPCLDCGRELVEESLLCPACRGSRQESGRLLRFDPDRRARTAGRLASTRCGSCGWSWWSVSPRGDAHCLACSEIAAGRHPRCAGCGSSTSWTTDPDGRKSCHCSPKSDGDTASPVEMKPEETR